MTNRRRLLGLVPIAALVFAACGQGDEPAPGEASPTIPFETPAMGESPWPQDTPPAEGTPGQDGAAAPTPGDDVAGDPDAAVAETLPDEVGGVPLTVGSLDDVDVTDRRVLAEVTGLISELGLGSDQLESAAATGQHETGEIVIVGIRVEGVDPDSILGAAEGRFALDPAAMAATRETVNGRDVLRVSDASAAAPDTYLFATDSTLYIVSADEVLAREALDQLPD
jgi:hypothetical protein